MATGKPILDTLGILWGEEDGDANLLVSRGVCVSCVVMHRLCSSCHCWIVPLKQVLMSFQFVNQTNTSSNKITFHNQQYTKSTAWYDDSRGWKSKQGGLSTVLPVTTDANNMGGLFLRKMSGVAGLAFHTTKLLPIVFHSPPMYESGGGKKRGGMVGASWGAGHFDPLLAIGMMGDVCVGLFYLVRLEDLKNAGAEGLGMAFVLASLVEALVFGLYLVSRRMGDSRSSTKTKSLGSRVNVTTGEYDPQEDPNALPSRIVARTVLIVTALISVISVRDCLFPGSILSFIPRDDIYLEWTGAFLHSPPPDTVESDEHGLEAPLYAGDKFVAQQMGMYLALGCLFKFASALFWSKGNRSMGGNLENVDRSGVVSSRMIWRAQALGDMMILGILRLFTPAAKSASLDLRWHLMFVAYEMFILCKSVCLSFAVSCCG